MPSARGDGEHGADGRSAWAPRVEALVVERLIAQLEGIWEHRLGLIVAPPGAGKTTLLAAFAAGAEAPVAWYRADPWERSEQAVLDRLSRAVHLAMDGPIDRRVDARPDLDGLIRTLESWRPHRALIVIDDLHVLDGSPAEALIERLLGRLPSGLRVIVGTRVQPRLNLSRLHISGELLELTGDDLRLRAWEVERLFRDHYREPMAPEELAHLARWTEGWAAGLQLFHLATRGRPADERRRVLRSLGPRSRLARDYLAQNALDRVPDDLRAFLLATSVLGRLNGRLCDLFLERTGSEMLLAELERRCLFTTRLNDEGEYRYHEVFRSHLQGTLLAEIGEAAVQARFRAAGDLLMSDGATTEALEAYVRAEAWDLVGPTLEVGGRTIADSGFGFLGPLEHQSLRDDPWLGLANARRLRAEGRFRDAAGAYAAVAGNQRSESAAEAARRERVALMAWLEPSGTRRAEPGSPWWSDLRRALRRDPQVVSRETWDRPDAPSRLVSGLCSLMAGDLARAQERLSSVEDLEEAEGLLACVASLARGCALLLAGDAEGVIDVNGAVGAAEGLGWEWLARIGRSALALSGRPNHYREAQRLEESAARVDDAWAVALARGARAWGALMSPDASDLAADEDPADTALAARDDLLVLGAPVLAAWATALVAIAAARRRHPRTGALVAEARGAARATETEVPDVLARLAQATWEADARAVADIEQLLATGWRMRVRQSRVEPERASGASHAVSRGAARLHRTPAPRPPALPSVVPDPPASLRLFGRFELHIGGELVDQGGLRPRVRSLLQLLSLHVNTPLHREVITEALWPAAHPVSSTRNLHVAVASLRRVLEPDATRGGFRLVRRDGEGYIFALPPGSVVDLIGFEQAVEETRQAARAGTSDAVERWGRAALERYRGDLLLEAGPAEWVLRRREALRNAAVEMATLLAGVLLDRGDHMAAAAIASDGLGRDRYHDPLWRIFIAAREMAGDRAAATSARAAYERALAELGIDPPVARRWRPFGAELAT